ncbi:MAG TPA: DUF3168 domain-containing protein [Beijerinckiaceae bacterium]|jgi:hypothetical protein
MSAALALQKTLRAALTADEAFAALIPPANVFDRHGRPERFPCVEIGEAQEVLADLTWDRRHTAVYLTLHAWDCAPGLTGVKRTGEAIRNVVRTMNVDVAPYRCLDLKVRAIRTWRDKDGQESGDQISHGVVQIEALMEDPV